MIAADHFVARAGVCFAMPIGMKMAGLLFKSDVFNVVDNGMKAVDELFGVFHGKAFFNFVAVFAERMVAERAFLRFIGRGG